MKGENQTIVRCKQPIKIGKPLQCLLTFSSAFVKEIFLRPLCCHFFVQFYVLNVLQSYNNINKVYVPGHKFYIFTVICVCQRYHPRLGLRQSETFPHLSNVFIIDDGSCAH